MTKQVFNPYMPSWEYVPDGEPHVLVTVYMFTGRTIFIMAAFFVWEIMSAIRLR